MGTAIVSLILIAIVSSVIFSMYSHKKSGKSSCDGECSHCKGGCH